MNERRPRPIRDLPLRWKILLPFAVLALAYALSATFVFSSGTAAEQRASLSARLRDAAAVTLDNLEERRFSLARSAIRVAGTEGLADAVARGARARVRRLALPQIVNAARSLAVVTDTRGTALLEVRITDGTPRRSSGGRWGDVDAVRTAVRAPRLSEIPDALVRREGGTLLVAVAPVAAGRGDPTGAVLVADRVDGALAALGTVTSASLAMFDADGELLAGKPMAAAPDDAPGPVQVSAGGSEVLYVPLTVGGRGAVLGIAMPAPSGVGALGSQAPKIAFLAIAVLAGVFAAGVLLSRRITNPIRRLVDSAHALQRGDLGHRASVDASDEIGQLADAFNQMAVELETSHRDLEARVEERTRELEDLLQKLDGANTELTRVSEAKSSFLASMSHELRTPLSGILMAGEMLADPTLSGLRPDQHADLGARIVRNGRHLLALIDDLLDLSRIEAGRIDLRPEEVRLGPMLTEAADAVRPLADGKGVRLRVPGANGQRVIADPLRLRQVMINLLTNAVKFTPSGGKAWVEVKAYPKRVAIAVRDTGVGIAPEDVERIFEPFEQAEGARKQGAGLGLAISRRLAELHGGTLTVDTAVGKGSTFTLSFPKVRPR